MTLEQSTTLRDFRETCGPEEVLRRLISDPDELMKTVQVARSNNERLEPSDGI